MKIIKYTIEPTSPWVYSLRSDTLHGLIACQVREWEGEQACKNLLASFLDNEPLFTCSSAFSKGFLPAPVLAPISRPVFRKNFEGKELFGNKNTKLVDWLQEYKIFKKKTLIPYAVWQKQKNALSALKLFSAYMGDKENFIKNKKSDKEKFSWEIPNQISGTELHLTINRNENKHLDGSYFSSSVNFANHELDIYVKASDHALFEKYFGILGELGFGADSTLGKGRFKIKNKEDVSDVFHEKGEYGLSLSVLSAENLAGIEGYYRTFTKKGKTWVAKSTLTPFKKPFIALEEGAVIKTVPSDCILKGIHADENIIQICNALFMPCTLSGENQ